MSPQQVDEVWELLRRRFPSAQAPRSDEVVREWSESLLRLDYRDAMAAVLRLSEESEWFPQSVAPIMALANDERDRRLRAVASGMEGRREDVNLTALWIAEARACASRHGHDQAWLDDRLAEIEHARQVGEQALAAAPAPRKGGKDRAVGEATG